MAGPRSGDYSVAEIAALVTPEGCLSVRVTPGTRVETLEILSGRVTAKVRARAEGGKANVALRDLLADALGKPTSRVILLRGTTSREKTFRILP